MCSHISVDQVDMHCCKTFYSLLVAFIVGVFIPGVAVAVPGADSFTLDGRLYSISDPTQPLLDPTATVRVQILNPTGTCVLYEQTQVVDTAATDGLINLEVGTPTGSGLRSGGDSGHTMIRIFTNSGTIAGTGGSCGPGYTPSSGDARKLRVIVTPTAGSPETLTPDMTLTSVPNAMVADTVQGLPRQNILEIGAQNLTQSNVLNIFSTTNYPLLTALLGGSSNQYVRSTPTGSTLPSFAADPVGSTEGQIWYDSVLNVIKYNDGSGGTPVTLSTAPALGYTPVDRAGDTMTGALNLPANGLNVGATQLVAENGRVGIGAASPSYRLTVSDSLVDNANAFALRVQNNPSFTANSAGNTASAYFNSNMTVASTVTHSGTVTGLRNQLSSAGAGTVSKLYGIHNTYQPGGLVTEAFGIYSAPYYSGGSTTATSYNLFLATASGSGTISKEYGLYQQSPSATNYFAGNVGIGTTTPLAKLHVGSTTSANLYLDKATGADYNHLMYLTGGLFRWAIVSSGPESGSNVGGNLIFNRYNDAGTLIDSPFTLHRASGTVGVGVTSPVTKLTVNGAISLPGSTGNTMVRPAVGASRLTGEIAGYSSGGALGDDGFLRLSAGGGTTASAKTFIDMTGYSTVSDMNKNITFGTSGAERMRIDASGNIGIGTDTPTARLHLRAGTVAAGTGPLKLGSGPLMTTPEDGSIEYNGTNFYLTIGSSRKVISSGGAAGTADLSVIQPTTGGITLTPNSGNSVIVDSVTTSTNPSSGALIVYGGAGIGGALNVSGAVTANSAITAASATPATGGANSSSPSIYLSANYWNGSASAVDRWSITNILGSGTNPSSTLSFGHTGSPGAAAYAFMNGSVGVGTSYPQATMHVVNPADGDLIIESGATTGGNAGFSLLSKTSGGVTNYTNIIADWTGNLVFRGAAGNYSFRNSGGSTTIMNIQNSGNVGIGTAPATSLHVYRAAGGNAAIFQGGASTGVRIDAAAGTSASSLNFSKASSQRWAFRADGTAESGSSVGTDFNLDRHDDAGTYIDTPLFIKRSSGYVGIGTTAPTNLLTVMKSSDAENGIDVRNNSTGSSAAASYYMRNSTSAGQFGMASTGHTFGGNISRNRAFLLADSASDGILMITESTDPVVLATNSLERMRVASNGNIGIGTSNPTYPMELVSASGTLTNLKLRNTNAAAWTGFDLYDSADTKQAYFGWGNPSASSAANVGYVGTNGAYPFAIYSNNQERMRFTSAGDAGIGTATPLANLHIHTPAGGSPKLLLSDGDVALPNYSSLGFGATGNTVGLWGNYSATVGGTQFTGFTTSGSNTGTPFAVIGYHGGTAPTSAALKLIGYKHDGGTGRAVLGASEPILEVSNGVSDVKLTVMGSGNVGIGTTSPSRVLEVVGSSLSPLMVNRSTSETNAIRTTAIYKHKTSSTIADGFGVDFTFSLEGNGQAEQAIANIMAVRSGNNSSGRLEFGTYSSGSLATKMAILPNGNVGIGTNNPQAKLDVTGTIRAEQICDEVGANCKDISTGWGSGGTPGGSDKQIQFNNASAFGGSANFVWDSATNRMGVGTSSPNSTLEVNSVSGVPFRVSSSAAPLVDITIDGSSDSLLRSGAGKKLGFATNASAVPFVTLDTGGNVGIGTTIPLLALHAERNQNNIQGIGVFNANAGTDARAAVVAGTSASKTMSIQSIGANFVGSAALEPNSGALMADVDLVSMNILTVNAAAPIRFFPGGPASMTLLPGGNVGIGTTTPTQKLEVDGKVKSTNLRMFASDSVSRTTSSSSFSTVPNLTLAVTGSGLPVVMTAIVQAHHNTPSAIGRFRLVVDGVVRQNLILQFASTADVKTANLQWIQTLSAGAHTVEVQWATDSGTLSNNWSSGNSSLMVIE